LLPQPLRIELLLLVPAVAAALLCSRPAEAWKSL
jgi:hypothetical protein